MQMYFADGDKVDEILGAVPENVIRSMVEDVLKRFPTDEKGSLTVLVNSWIEHNKQDSDKFRKWVEKAKGSKGLAGYDDVVQAAQEMEKATQRLAETFRAL